MWISLPNWSFFADIIGFKLFGEKEIRLAPNGVFQTLKFPKIDNYVIDKLLRNHPFLMRNSNSVVPVWYERCFSK